MSRTDIHRPSVIDPTQYDFVSFDYFGGSDLGAIMALEGQRAIFRAHMARTNGKYAVHQNSGSCHICGANAIYVCRWYCAATNEYIMTGEDCAFKLDMSCGDMNAFRRGIHDAVEAHAGKKKALVILTDLGIEAAYAIYLQEYPQHTVECISAGQDEHGDDNGSHYDRPCTCDLVIRARAFDQFEEHTIRDIVSKLVKFGSISDKASEFVRNLIAKIDNRPAIEAQRAAEAEAAAPVPIGRVIITGRVLAIKTVERQTYYHGDDGMATKVLIQDLSGFKVWGNRFINADKGDLITFTATLEPSKDDAKFGFFSRPAKAFYVTEETGEIIQQ